MDTANVPVDPWTVVVKASKVDMPIGTYFADFLRVEQCTIALKDGAKEQRLRWWFKVSTGPQAGTEINDISDTVVSDRNKSGRIVGGLKGSELRHGESAKEHIDAAVGKKWLVQWGKGAQGGIGIQSVSAMPAM